MKGKQKCCKILLKVSLPCSSKNVKCLTFKILLIINVKWKQYIHLKYAHFLIEHFLQIVSELYQFFNGSTMFWVRHCKVWVLFGDNTAKPIQGLPSYHQNNLSIFKNLALNCLSIKLSQIICLIHWELKLWLISRYRCA